MGFPHTFCFFKYFTLLLNKKESYLQMAVKVIIAA